MNVPLIDLLYDLKRDWGRPIRYLSPTTSEADPETGQVVTGEHEYFIAQVVLFPISVARTFVSAFRAGNFPYDSTYDKGTHVGLVQKSDLPLGVKPSTADKIITTEGQQYDIVGTNDLLEAWEFTLVELPAT